MRTVLHDGMIRCEVCGYFNLFTEKDTHPVVPGCFTCHLCKQIVPAPGVQIIDVTLENR